MTHGHQASCRGAEDRTLTQSQQGPPMSPCTQLPPGTPHSPSAPSPCRVTSHHPRHWTSSGRPRTFGGQGLVQQVLVFLGGQTARQATNKQRHPWGHGPALSHVEAHLVHLPQRCLWAKGQKDTRGPRRLGTQDGPLPVGRAELTDPGRAQGLASGTPAKASGISWHMAPHLLSSGHTGLPPPTPRPGLSITSGHAHSGAAATGPTCRICRNRSSRGSLSARGVHWTAGQRALSTGAWAAQDGWSRAQRGTHLACSP